MKSANVSPEIAAMAYELADSVARSDIECHCVMKEHRWYETGILKYKDDRAVVDFALRYLDARGLVNRHPNNPEWVNFEGVKL